MDAEGSCKSSITLTTYGCAGYCEVKNYFFYGNEVHISEFSECRQQQACTYTTTNTLTITQTFEFNLAAGLGKRNGGEDLSKRESEALKPSFDLVRFNPPFRKET